MGRAYRVGTRNSHLALKQVEEAIKELEKACPGFQAKPVSIETWGDKDKTKPISEIEGSDFFTREIDRALLKKQIDFAVHSAKDLPDRLREGLAVAAVTASVNPYDALVSKGNLKLDELPIGARIGTSSTRRKDQVKAYRKDFEAVDIRGTIGERLWQLPNSNLDAILIAAAGLIRLGLEEKISQVLPFEIIKPHPLQGSLALVTRSRDRQLLDLLSVLDTGKIEYLFK